ncbi:TraB/GumN family protein [Brevundimonas sp. NPDC090276]|uniref:TraB/GumN family protein n=1 Tax=Brevundimonas sp. NPDC090276 TaxID=3363956 RepID=UPI00383B7EB5
MAPRFLTVSVVVLALSLGAAARAQDASPAPVTTVDEVIVSARRAEAPIWQVTRGDSTLILVGAISGVPRDVEWRPEALEAATRRSQRILFPQEGRASVADVIRLIWRIRTVATLPRGTTTADYLSPPVQARLETVMADQRNDNWRTNSLMILSMDLMSEQAGYERGRTRTAADVIKKVARDARIPVRPVGTVRGDEIVESLISAPPATYAACLERALAAAEAGPEGGAIRINDWRARRVPEVMAQPLEQALGLCWPWGDPEIAPLLRRQWAEAVQTALGEPGVTMAVAQLRVLAEPDGVLDTLAAQGYEIEGPEWKPAPVEAALP